MSARPNQQLHGDAHPGNIVRSGGEWLWLDLEETMRGPVEWDLAAMLNSQRIDGAEVVRVYGADQESVRPFHMLRRLYGLVWTVLLSRRQPDRWPGLRQELERLRYGES